MPKKPTYNQLQQRVKELENVEAECKEAAEALRKERDLAQHYLEVANVITIVIDADQRVSLINKKGCEILGCEENEVVGKKWFDTFVPERDREETKTGFVRLIAGEIEPVEFYQNPILTKDGNEKLVAWHNTILRDKEGKITATLSSGEDITERKRAAEALQQSEKRYRDVVDNANSIILRWNAEGNIVYMNPFGLDFFGYSEEELLGRNVAGSIVPVTETLSERDLAAMVRDIQKDPEKYKHNENENVRKDGSRVWVTWTNKGIRDELGNVVEVLSVGYDSTDRKRAEEKTKESERRYRELYERSRDGYAMVDMKGKIIESNCAFREMLGYTEQELREKTYEDITTEKWHVEEAGVTQEQVFERGYSELFEKEYIRKDGTVFPIEIRVSLERDERGNQVGMWAWVRDITDRRQAEEELRKEKEKAQGYLDVAGAAILAIDVDQTVSLVNKEGCRILGFKEEKIVGKNWFENFLPEAIREEVRTYFTQLIAEKVEPAQFFYENPILTKTGEERIVSWVTVPLRDEEGRIVSVLSSGIDTTERVYAEHELRKSEAEKKAILDASVDCIMYVDREMKIIWVNKAMADVYNKPSKDLIGRTCHEVLAGMDDPCKGCSCARAMSTGGVEYEVLFQRDLGVVGDSYWENYGVPVKDDSGRIIGGIEIGRNITERVKAEETLRESEQRYRGLFENSRDGIVMTSRGGAYVDVNQAALDLFGYTRDEMLAMNAIETYANPHDREELLKALEIEGYAKDYELTLKRKDGTEMACLTTSTLRRDNDGNILGVQGIMRDITDQKRLQAQLFQAQKMESLGTLVAGVAHEINNPINAIKFNAPLFQRIWHDVIPIVEAHVAKEPNKTYGGLPYEFLRENLEQLLADINGSADRIIKIVTNLKSFSRQSDLAEKEPVQLNETIRSTLGLTQISLTERGIELNLNVENGLPEIEGDRQSIEQILLNLIVNATQAIKHEKGKLEIASRYDKKRKQVVVEVTDNGEGIDPAIRNRVFDPFATTRQTEGGTGLGLSVTYSLVEAHEGAISFKSKGGKGTTFRVSFPVCGGEGVEEGGNRKKK